METKSITITDLADDPRATCSLVVESTRPYVVEGEEGQVFGVLINEYVMTWMENVIRWDLAWVHKVSVREWMEEAWLSPTIWYRADRIQVEDLGDKETFETLKDLPAVVDGLNGEFLGRGFVKVLRPRLWDRLCTILNKLEEDAGSESRQQRWEDDDAFLYEPEWQGVYTVPHTQLRDVESWGHAQAELEQGEPVLVTYGGKPEFYVSPFSSDMSESGGDQMPSTKILSDPEVVIKQIEASGCYHLLTMQDKVVGAIRKADLTRPPVNHCSASEEQPTGEEISHIPYTYLQSAKRRADIIEMLDDGGEILLTQAKTPIFKLSPMRFHQVKLQSIPASLIGTKVDEAQRLLSDGQVRRLTNGRKEWAEIQAA